VGDLFLLQMIKAFLITGILAVIFGFISLVVLCLSDKKRLWKAGANTALPSAMPCLSCTLSLNREKSLRRSRLYG